MGILDTIMNAQGQGSQPTAALAQKFGLSEQQVGDALKQLMPALNEGMKRNTAQQGGLESLMGAISGGQHQKYLDQPELLAQDGAQQEGNGILGHLLGSKDVSRAVAQHASEKTGIDNSIMKQMLPMAATMLMGSLSKNQGAIQDGGQPSGGMLSKMLDADGDGSAADDVVGMISKLF